jgi:hypothetical protein
VANFLGSTAVSYKSYNDSFSECYLRYLIGATPVGKALNSAKNDTQNASEKSGFSIGNFSYTLYGAPWNVYSPPPGAAGAGATVLAEHQASTLFNTSKSGVLGTYVKAYNEAIDSYQVIQQSSFDFISIPGYKQLMSGLNTTPVLPIKVFEINLPKDVTINDVEIIRSNPVNLGARNIPVFNDQPPLIGITLEPIYNSAPDSIGLFDFGFEYYLSKHKDYNTLFVKVVPATYNTATNEAVLFQNYQINVSYDTIQNGVLISALPEKRYYNSGEVINVVVSIDNVIDQSTQFEAVVELTDPMQNTVQTQAGFITIDPSMTGQTTLQLQAPSKGGGYWVDTYVNDGAQEIGSAIEHINVTNGSITDLIVPQCIPGTTVDFIATCHNFSNATVDASVGLTIYDGATPVAEFIPVVYTVAAGSDQDATFTWEVPVDFPVGKYLVVATATIEDYTSSMSKEMSIGEEMSLPLGQGWNLVSFNLSPINPDPGNFFNSINGKYSSVWGYKNGAWLVYNSANPGLSDLAAIEAGAGYWINMDEAATLNAIGFTPPTKAINLAAGWNLVGFNSETALPIADALASIDRKYISVWGYAGGAWKFYDPAYPGFSNLKQMGPGAGYWINAKQACAWTLP